MGKIRRAICAIKWHAVDLASIAGLTFGSAPPAVQTAAVQAAEIVRACC